MQTRNTTAEQAEENRAIFEAQKDIKRQDREEKKERQQMTSNISTQLLLKNVPPVENFTGAKEQDPVTWLEDIEALFNATKIDNADRRRLLPLHLGEEAKKWYRSGTFDEDYEQFKKQFLEAFKSPVYKLQLSAKLMNRKQGLEESVQSYYYDVLSLCNRFNPNMEEDEKVVYVLRGLKPSLQQHIAVNECKTCIALFNQAKQTEAMSQLIHQQDSTAVDDSTVEVTAALRRTSIQPTNRYQNSGSRNQQRQDYYRNTSQDNQSRPSYQSRQHRSAPVCYTCSGNGHYSSQCPNHLN